MIRLLDAGDLERALPMAAAVGAMRAAFVALHAGRVEAPPRGRVVDDVGTTLLMAAAAPGVGRLAKIVSVFPGNPARGLPTIHGLVLVLDPETGAVRGLCDGAALTAIRTGAATGLATDLLARPDAEVLAVLGAGAQARTQVLGVAAVRRLREVRVHAPRRDRTMAFAAALAAEVGVEVRAATSSAMAIAGADIVCAATSSSVPVLDGDRLRPGTHINGVGSFRLDMRELDERTIARADRVVVDQRSAALEEAGELVAALSAGVTAADDWVELGALLGEPARGRAGDADITLFKSVGHAVQDLFAAASAVAAAERLGLGREIGFG